MNPMSRTEIGSRLTPYDDLYETCERTCAKLLIYPGEQSPDTITECLGIVPTQVNRKGEKRISQRTGRSHIVKMNGWFLFSEEHVVSKDLRRHLDWLIERLGPAREPLLALQETTNVVMTISCVWWSAHGHGGPTLWPQQMRAMADLGLECSFDVYFFGEQFPPVPDGGGGITR